MEPVLAAGTRGSPISYEDALENYRQNTDWWVVFAAFDLPDFQSNPIWISEKTKLPTEVVVEALEGLSILGYLKKDHGAFYPIKGKDFVNFEIVNKNKAKMIEEHSMISRQIVNNLNEEAIMAVDHRCFASNVETLKELYSDIAKAFDKAYKASQQSNKNNMIFKMTFTAVDVLQGREQ